jgi:hypothetical protein
MKHIKTQLLVLAVIAMTGCSSSYIRGPGFTASNHRLLWMTTDFTASMPMTNGQVFSITLKSSNAQSDAIAAVAEGVARGLAK